MGVVLASTLSSQAFASRLAIRLGLRLANLERQHFPDGEEYLRFQIDDHLALLGQHVVLVGSADQSTSFEEMYRLAWTASKRGARSLIMVIPYLGYSTMERADLPGEVVTVKAIARQFSGLPRAAQGNWILMMDLHTPGIVHYFEGDTVALELRAQPAIVEAIRNLNLRNPCLASTDMGRAKWVEGLANRLDTPIALIHKKRVSGSDTKVAAVVGDVTGLDVVIYDDMIRTGNSLLAAGEAYMKAGAASVHAVATHLVLPEGAVERLSQGPFARIIGADTHPRHAIVENHPRFQIVPTAHLFADVIARLVF